MKKADWILLCCLLSLSVLALAVLFLSLGKSGEVAVVTVNGEEIARLPLNEDTELLIEGYNGGSNLLVIQDGAAFLTDATCPDRICIHTGKADSLRSIVCAPNRVVVTVESE